MRHHRFRGKILCLPPLYFYFSYLCEGLRVNGSIPDHEILGEVSLIIGVHLSSFCNKGVSALYVKVEGYIMSFFLNYNFFHSFFIKSTHLKTNMGRNSFPLKHRKIFYFSYENTIMFFHLFN